MGWFGKKRAPQDANEMLRRYNEAEAERLAGITGGASAAPVAATTLSAGAASAELVVEDVFSITGRGQVATGRVASGVLRVGDRIVVIRDADEIGASEITALEMFGSRADQAAAGTMVGVLFRGKLDIGRGDLIRARASA